MHRNGCIITSNTTSLCLGKNYHHANLFRKTASLNCTVFFKFEPTYLSTYQHLFLATVLPTTHCKEKQTAIVLWSQFSYLLLLLFQIDATIIFSECWTQLWDFSILYSWYASSDRFFFCWQGRIKICIWAQKHTQHLERDSARRY